MPFSEYSIEERELDNYYRYQILDKKRLLCLLSFKAMSNLVIMYSVQLDALSTQLLISLVKIFFAIGI